MRIELVGGLGIGKTTLCDALAQVGFNAIYENLGTNPFLDDCFRDPASFRFPSQMWFVLSKFHEIKKFERPGSLNVVDQSVMNVRAYTNMLFRHEDPQGFAVIEKCFEYLEGRLGAPDMLVDLRCSAPEQLRRIRNRNRDHERDVDIHYIESLQQEIDLLLKHAVVQGVPVLTIDTEEVYFPNNHMYAGILARRIAARLGLKVEAAGEGKAGHAGSATEAA